jgi:hypothetical protein
MSTRGRLLLSAVFYATQAFAQTPPTPSAGLTAETAAYLARFPLGCIDKPFPYKTGVSYGDSTFIRAPQEYHPAFFGCFDWHSSVHGHWTLARLLRLFPSLPQSAQARDVFRRHITVPNIRKELEVFRSKDNLGFERTYGWAWLLMLQMEFDRWGDPEAREWARALKPLSDTVASYTLSYLRRLVYPIRTGEHNNLAFGLSFIHDYALHAGRKDLSDAIRAAALRFYGNDRGCPVSWEPGGSDFLSPCLEEADLMRRVLAPGEYSAWLKGFMPDLFRSDMRMEPGRVLDRTDGKLVHLDGLNFSRAWCLRSIGKSIGNPRLIELSDMHLKAAMDKMSSGDYAGEHWLASFAVYALTADSKH